MALLIEAEQFADNVRDIPEFANFSLPGVRDRVAELLGLIGRSEGIFATYTKHDISHIDMMLKMLKWLIPQSTTEKMTSADWLLIVLAIYLHDLGLLVTSEEYEKRGTNPDFRKWFESLDKTLEGKEYLARTNRMTASQKDKFFFQEFVRMGHAARIREWVTGRHSRKWGAAVKPIADAITHLLEPLPNRFRQYLGDVCESHHANDLDRIDKYPLNAPCASDDAAVVNVQYAAILLRTADLLHVTQDRTPSIMYQLLRLSDPKGVDEWDKQLGTFSVRPKKREIDITNPDSMVIQISADFTEERPLFALQEYITYANNQITQSKRWTDKSQQDTDARRYIFPWYSVRGDVRLEGVPPRPLKFELDRGRLLDLLVGHTIYNDPTVAIRELLQNGIDAVRYQHHLACRDARAVGRELPAIGKVSIRWNPKEHTLTIDDDGVGMDEDIIKHHLMTVGVSFYNTPQFEAEHSDFSPISRFGIGILTCFMVSDDIEIVTCRGDKGFRIRMTSVHADYLLRELPSEDEKLLGLAPHGSRVTLRLRETIDFSAKSVGDIVRYWVILPACSVEYIEEGRKPEKIGYTSTQEALREFNAHASETALSTHEGWQRATDIVVKTRYGADISGNDLLHSSYELAFAVDNSWKLERSFAPSTKNQDAAVCIEGIRVADALPWCRSDGFSALLAVSGDRRFRTTVSRSGLEKDDEFERVGLQCFEMLFDHIKDEVTRIANQPGKPFSQASSAAKWLYSRLQEFSNKSACYDHLDRMYNELPSMVIERFSESSRSEAPTTRAMVSRRDLQNESSGFWTVESRLVDSLGTISRDLGRELSLNEFLAALAPESKHLQFSPLVLDAHQFVGAVTRSHSVDKVQFSRHHQQTAIHWSRDLVPSVPLSLNPQELFRETPYAISHGWSTQRAGDIVSREYYGGRAAFPEIKFMESQIVGDDQKVQVVISRMGRFIQSASEGIETWKVIRRAVLDMAKKDPASDRLFDTYSAALAFARSLGVCGRDAGVFKSWTNYVDTLRDAIADAGLAVNLPDELRERQSEHVFNASSYWRNWD